MKKLVQAFIVLVTLFFFFGEVAIQAQTLVSKWGKAPIGGNWPIQNDLTFVNGSATLGDGSAPPTGWASILGEFDPVTPTNSQAFVITGNLELVGGGGAGAYTWMRYALFNQTGTLSGQNTDTAAWKNVSPGNGYIFTPVTGTGTISNTYRSWPQGNQGTEWPLINGTSWNSTNSNGGGPISTVRQAPYRAIATEGVYDWAFSVQPMGNGMNEVRWYLIKQHAANVQPDYWWGGSFIDTVRTTSFNKIGFAFNNDLEATQAKLTNVSAGLGNPITVPVAPFQSFYVNMWGKAPIGGNWPIQNDTTFLDGNATLGNGSAPPTGWSSVLGGFREDVKPTTDRALVVTGKLELVGGGGAGAYTWMRYALFNQTGTLSGQNTDTAAWKNVSSGNGYIFTPVTGTGTISNTYRSWPQGNQGTEWPLINGTSWNSTNSNGGGPISTVRPAPYRAIATEGVYDWAFSVQPMGNGMNEVRWYLIKQHAANQQTDYWWGGSFIDTVRTTSFNKIGFAFNNDLEATQAKLLDVNVNLGDPITVPAAPFNSFYVDQWGILDGRTGGRYLTKGEIVGDVTLSGTTSPTSWISTRGGFIGNAPESSRDNKALIVTGSMEFEGTGSEAWSGLRYGIFYSDSAGTLADSTWSGSERNSYGYLFLPPQGNSGATNWATINQKGTVGAVVNGPWLGTSSAESYVLTDNVQKPSASVGSPGVYNFAFSIFNKDDGSVSIKYYLVKADNSYYFAGSAIDNHSPKAATKFNSVNFAVNSTIGLKAMKLSDIKIDLGSEITIPTEPTGVDDIESLPTSYLLNQNFPNPFNPSTTIEFALPQNSNVKLIVYDILGRTVENLVNENLSAGYHQINFNASKLSSGVYFYKIEAGDFVSVKKLMLLK